MKFQMTVTFELKMKCGLFGRRYPILLMNGNEIMKGWDALLMYYRMSNV